VEALDEFAHRDESRWVRRPKSLLSISAIPSMHLSKPEGIESCDTEALMKLKRKRMSQRCRSDSQAGKMQRVLTNGAVFIEYFHQTSRHIIGITRIYNEGMEGGQYDVEHHYTGDHLLRGGPRNCQRLRYRWWTDASFSISVRNIGAADSTAA
jgi:hypothetical protein